MLSKNLAVKLDRTFDALKMVKNVKMNPQNMFKDIEHSPLLA